MKHPSSLRRPRALFALLFVVALVSTLFVAAPLTASAQTALSQCNGTDNVGGQAVECRYTVTNTLAEDTTSSTVTLTECHGAANDPATLVCSSSTSTSAALVTSVDQCNGSGNGGGGTVTCSVDVVNNITGTVTPTSATVNQCNASGTGGGTAPTVLCDPFPANTTGATVTQCNEAGNGGGGTQRVRCTVDSGSTTTSVLSVTVNQCNGSGNGGGATVVCRTSVTNNVQAPSPAPSATPSPIVPPVPDSTPKPGVTPVPDSTPAPEVTPAPDQTPRPGLTPVPDSTPVPEQGRGDGPTAPGPFAASGEPDVTQNPARPSARTPVTRGAPGRGSSIDTGQVTHIPVGGAAAGGGSTSGLENIPLLVLGSLFLIAAGSGLQIRRRIRSASYPN